MTSELIPRMGRQCGKEFDWNELVDEENQSRNALKHMRDPQEVSITADLEEAIAWMLARVCDNYDRLGIQTTEDIGRFNSWFWENMVGV